MEDFLPQWNGSSFYPIFYLPSVLETLQLVNWPGFWTHQQFACSRLFSGGFLRGKSCKRMGKASPWPGCSVDGPMRVPDGRWIVFWSGEKALKLDKVTFKKPGKKPSPSYRYLLPDGCCLGIYIYLISVWKARWLHIFFLVILSPGWGRYEMQLLS